jgi:CubicO group peptidase (beta-lactamase class C family)
MSEVVLSVEIKGFCDPRFQQLADIFQKNFDEGPEVGASLAVTREGEVVVDLWAGLKDQEKATPWEQDTLVLVFSSTKFPVTLCALRLIDQGKLDPDKPIAYYWPEFVANGKDSIPVKQIFNHTSGVFCFDPPYPWTDQFDFEGTLARLAGQAPSFEPGSLSAYHGSIYGFLVGGLVYNITGSTPGQYLKDEITGPLDIDFHIGSSMDEVARMATIIPMAEEEVKPGILATKEQNQFLGPQWTGLECITAELPSANGLGNARSLAQLASIMAMNGTLNNYQVMSPATVDLALTELGYVVDSVNDLAIRWGFGFGLNSDEFECPSDDSLHWGGAGGSVLIADRKSRTSFGYAMNYMWPGFGDDPRTDPMRLVFNDIVREL